MQRMQQDTAGAAGEGLDRSARTVEQPSVRHRLRAALDEPQFEQHRLEFSAFNAASDRADWCSAGIAIRDRY